MMESEFFFAIAQKLLLTWNTSFPVPVTAFVLDMKNSRDVYWVEEYRGMNTSHAITGLTAGEIFEFRYGPESHSEEEVILHLCVSILGEIGKHRVRWISVCCRHAINLRVI